MARLPDIKREDLAPADQQHFDSIAGSRGSVRGPFPMLLHSPDLAARIANAGAYVRFESTLEPSIRELAILTVAREWDCLYEWAAHAPQAKEAGLRDEAIAAVRDKTAPAGLSANEAIVFDYVSALLTTKRVPAEKFQAVLDMLGRRSLMELTATAGYYCMLACVMDACEVVPPADTEHPLPV